MRARRCGLWWPVMGALGVFLFSVAAPSAAFSQEKGKRGGVVIYDPDPDKLFNAPEKSWSKLASRLAFFADAQRQGQDSHARIELFFGELHQSRLEDASGRYIKESWTFHRRGDAQVLGTGKKMWIPREGDVGQTVKELWVRSAPGGLRTIRFLFRVHASKSEKVGLQDRVTVLGREEIELQIIEDPRDKTLRVLLDPQTYLKNQTWVTSNRADDEPAAEEGKPAAEEEKEEKKPESPDRGDAPQPTRPEEKRPKDPRSEITLVKSFKADDNSIIVRFRKKWSGAEDKVVDGTLQIQLDTLLSTALFYEVPAKSGKPAKVKAAYFQKGNRIR